MGTVRQLAQQFESLITRSTVSKAATASTDASQTASPPAAAAAQPADTPQRHADAVQTTPVKQLNSGTTAEPITTTTTTTQTATDNVPAAAPAILLTPPPAAHNARRHSHSTTVQHWTCNTLFNRLSNYSSLMCIDIRTAVEYEQGHIPRAINIPLDTARTALTVADIEAALQSLTDKRVFKCRARNTVVVYSTTDSEPMLDLLCSTLLAENRILAAVTLTGGYMQYSADYPYAVCNNANAVQSHMSLPAALDLEPHTPGKLNSSTLATPLQSPLRTQSHDAGSPLSALKLSKHIHRSAFPWYPSEVLVHQLYLGSHTDAANLDTLHQLGVTHVLNVSAEVENMYPQQFAYEHIMLPDTADSDITAYFQRSNAFIQQCLQQRGRVLVHCYQGVSRSSTLVIAYIMQTQRCTLHQAYTLVLNARKQIMPNVGFWKQLAAYECSVLQTQHSTLEQCVDIAAMEAESALKAQHSDSTADKRANTTSSGPADVVTVG